MLSKRNLAIGARPNLNPPISAEARRRIAEASKEVTTPRLKRRVPCEAMAAGATLVMAIVDSFDPELRREIHQIGLTRVLARERGLTLKQAVKKLARRKLYREHYALVVRHSLIKP